MTFTLDTSGVVWLQLSTDHVRGRKWSDLDPFTQGYVEAMLAFAASGAAVPHGWYVGPNEARARFSDLAPETLAAILKDCARMCEMIGGALIAEDGRRVWEHRQAGFPGPGHLDGKLGAAFPPLAPTLGDDGKVYLREDANQIRLRGE